MVIELVQQPSRDVEISLQRLVENICPYPGCELRPTHVVMLCCSLAEKPSFENCLPLCSKHATLAIQGDVDSDMLRTIRQLLRPARSSTRNEVQSQVLATRSEYLEKVCHVLAQPISQLRCIYVGPLPFHPAWYFTYQTGATKSPSMDEAVAKLIADPNCHVRIILRNSPRYLEKVKHGVPKSLLNILIDETMSNIFTAFNDSSNEITCGETGAFKIPLIADNSYISALRGNPSSPIEAGIYSTDLAQVDWEATAYDKIFEHFTALTPDPLKLVCDFINQLRCNNGEL